MQEVEASELVEEILAAVVKTGAIGAWIERRCDGTVRTATLEEVGCELTRRLIAQDPPDVAHWERFLVAAAAANGKPHQQNGYQLAKAAIEELVELIHAGQLQHIARERLVSVASAVTLALTAERKLRQPASEAVGQLCERFPEAASDMAELCQQIWQRRGQMTGEDGLFAWDTRNQEWRLRQDFKAYRPDS